MLWTALKTKPPFFGKNIAMAENLFPDHLRCSIRKRFLGIYPPSPKGQIFAIGFFQMLWVHPFRTDLHGIYYVEPRINKTFHEVFHCPARVLKSFPTGVIVYPVVNPPVVG